MFKKFSVITPEIMATEGLFKAGRSTHTIIHHCAATPEGKNFTVEQIDQWHKNRGWRGIGYHFYIDLDGVVFAGRPLNEIGAHVAGHNTGTIGICYCGGVASDGKTPKDTRTEKQKQAQMALTKALVRDNWDIERIAGHNEYAMKACPSFDVRGDDLGNFWGFKFGKAT